MHWVAETDARDVEFVLGSGPTLLQSQPVVSPLSYAEIKEMRACSSILALTTRDFRRRVTHLWVLDFNQCSDISLNREGVARAVDAFLINDPYFPRLLADNRKDQKLWKVFRDKYLSMAESAVSGKSSKVRELPRFSSTLSSQLSKTGLRRRRLLFGVERWESWEND